MDKKRKEIRENIAMAGLLHDIGKFFQRTEKFASTEKSENLSADVMKQISSICGRYQTHKHSLWTAEFLKLCDNHIFQNPISQTVYNMAVSHHHPGSLYEKIIQYGDWISSGTDRQVDNESSENARSYNFRKQRLIPVFESIFCDDYKTEKKFRYKIEKLDLSNAFPHDFTGEDMTLNHEYSSLWWKFIEEMKKLKKIDFKTNYNTILALLKKYTWCIPSSTVNRSDISLYDHLKTTSALSIIFYDYLYEKYKGQLDESPRKAEQLFNSKNEPITKLICGDLSGIQSFIYQISSAKASVSLKGRSFAVKMICDICTKSILNALNLPESHCVYSSGGNFYIMAANTDETNKRLREITNKLNCGLYQRYKGELYLAIGQSEISINDMMFDSTGNSQLGEKWQEAIRSAAEKKQHKFKETILNDRSFFDPFGEVENVELCSICGTEDRTEKLVDLKDDKKVCRSCHEFIQIGKKLKNAEILLEYNEEDEKKQLIPGIPIKYDIIDPGNSIDLSGKDNCTFYSLNNSDFLLEWAANGKCAYSFMFYGGNKMPQQNGNNASFSEMSESPSSLKRLGFIRMDVDSLGHIFKSGFSKNRMNDTENGDRSFYSLSRLSTLSSMLDYFFSGHINEIHQSTELYRNHVQIIYAGGDDLFLVGRWDAVCKMAFKIHDSYKRFTAYHPRFTLSGGMAITHDKFPVHRAADISGKAESQAKELVTELNGDTFEKDAFNIFGKSVHWHDMHIIKEMKDDIVTVSKDLDSSGLINRLRKIYLSYMEDRKELQASHLSGEELKHIVEFRKWRWRMVYNLQRFSKTVNEEQKKQIEEIQKFILDGHHYKNMKTGLDIRNYLDIPARWAELEIR